MGTRLIRLLFLLALAPILGLASEPAPNRAVFRGPLMKVGTLHDYTGNFILVHRNPRFFLKIRLAGGATAPLEWKDGEVVVLAVNSLNTLFGDEPKVGATYSFSVRCERHGDRLTCDDLRLESHGPG